jgi:hypothetical protein
MAAGRQYARSDQAGDYSPRAGDMAGHAIDTAWRAAFYSQAIELRAIP